MAIITLAEMLESKKEIESLKEEIDERDQRIEELNQKLTEMEDASDEVRKLEGDIESRDSEIEELKEKIEELEDHVGDNCFRGIDLIFWETERGNLADTALMEAVAEACEKVGPAQLAEYLKVFSPMYRYHVEDLL